MRFHEVTHGIYFDDLDAFRILHNNRYLLLFERGIGSFWQHLGYGSPLDPTEPDQHHLVRTNAVEYHRPVPGVGQVRVRVWVEAIGRTSLTFGFRMLPMDQDVDHATGTRVVVRIDPETLRPLPWSQELRRRIEPYLRIAQPTD